MRDIGRGQKTPETGNDQPYMDPLMCSIRLDEDYWRLRLEHEGLGHDSADLVDEAETWEAVTGVNGKEAVIAEAIRELTQGLNSQQKEAVTSTARQLAITAIPGAGKTKTSLIVEKIRAIRLSETGRPTNTEQSTVLSLTFGREATVNASVRSNADAGDWFMPGIQHKTIHSLAKEICDAYGDNPPLLCDPSSPKAYTEADMMEHAPEDVSVEAKMDYEDRYNRAKETAKHVARKLLELAGEAKEKYNEQGNTRTIIKNAMTAELGQDTEDRLTEAEKYVWGGYVKEMAANNAVDYGLLVLNATKYLESLYTEMKKEWKKKGEWLTRKYRGRNTPKAEADRQLRADFRAFVDGKLQEHKWVPNVKCLIVDEAQDVNQSQIGLLEALVKLRDPDYIVIGDPYQAIYRFQGSDSSYIEEVGSPLKGKRTSREGSYAREGETIHLTLNYRSTREILETANGVFYRNSPYRMEPAPVTVDGNTVIPSDAPTQGYLAYNHWDEDHWVYTHIRQLIESGTWTAYEGGHAIQHRYQPEDIAILARQWGRLDEFVRDCGYRNRKECTSLNCQLSTVHSAKGKQWKAVFVIGLSQQTWRQDELMDAKCLLHVALTRAERRLFLSWATVETINNQQASVNKLRLLDNIRGVQWTQYEANGDSTDEGIERDEADEISDLLKAAAAEPERDVLGRIRLAKLQNLDLARIFALEARNVKGTTKDLETRINAAGPEDKPALQTEMAHLKLRVDTYAKKATDLIDCARGEFVTVSYNKNDPVLKQALLTAKTAADLPDDISDRLSAHDSKESVCGQRVCNKSNEVRAKRLQIELGSDIKYAFDENAKLIREGELEPGDALANPVFITMTSPNVPADRIRDEIEIYKKAIYQMQLAGKDYEHFDPTGNHLRGEMTNKDVCQWKTDFWRKAVRGSFYSIEIVPKHRDDGTNDYHVHAHMLLLTTRQYYWEEHRTPRGKKKDFKSRFFLSDSKQSTFRAWHDWWTRCYFYARAKFYGYDYRDGFIENPLDPDELAYAEEHGYSIPGVYKDDNGQWAKRTDESGKDGTDVTGLLFTDVRSTYNKNSKHYKGGYSKEGIQYAVFETAKYITKYLELVPTPERVEHEDGSVTYEQKLDDDTLLKLIIPFTDAIEGVNTFSRFQTIKDIYERAQRTERWLNGDETVAGITYQQYRDYLDNPDYGLIGINEDYVSGLRRKANRAKKQIGRLGGEARRKAEREYRTALSDYQSAQDTAEDLPRVHREAIEAHEDGGRALPTKDNLDVDDPKALMGTAEVLDTLENRVLPNLTFDRDLPDDSLDDAGFPADHPTNPSFLTPDWLAEQYLANDKDMEVITKHKYLWDTPAYRYVNVSTEGGDSSEKAMKDIQEKIRKLDAQNQKAHDDVLGETRTSDVLGFGNDDDEFGLDPDDFEL